jgi:putative CocE/NonD family hydrolase
MWLSATEKLFRTGLIGLIAAGLFFAKPAHAEAPERHAVPILMPDHVTLAADLIRPPAAGRLPTVLVMTPYGRATRMSAGAIDAFASAGLALVFVDMRGTGASQGHVSAVFSREERADIGAIIKWISRQPWSDGRVVTTGISYDANLAALALVNGGKSLAAAVPRFIDFDTYRDLALPGGVRNEMLLRDWGALTETLNRATPCLVDVANCGSLQNLEPLDGDSNDTLLRQALLDHQKNWNTYIDTAGYAFDDDAAPSGRLLRDGFLSSQTKALRDSKVPVQIWGSWFDAGTADSALAWYEAAPKAPLELYLGAWAHGGNKRTDPFLSGTLENESGAPVPAAVFLDFVQRALNASAPKQRRIVYYTAGAAVWRKTASWPPAYINSNKMYFGSHDSLNPAADLSSDAADTYVVDFTASTGKANRWTTQLGGGIVDYGDRAEADRKLRTYTSEPLDRDIEITGAPSLTVHIASTYPDVAVFAYLEAVEPTGKVVYLSEGELRLALRGGNGATNHPQGMMPSFLRRDTAFLEPGRPIEAGISLHNISVMIPKGDRLRIAVAGADADTFARYPQDGAPTFTIYRSSVLPSFIDLPMADWKHSAGAVVAQ